MEVPSDPSERMWAREALAALAESTLHYVDALRRLPGPGAATCFYLISAVHNRLPAISDGTIPEPLARPYGLSQDILSFYLPFLPREQIYFFERPREVYETHDAFTRSIDPDDLRHAHNRLSYWAAGSPHGNASASHPMESMASHYQAALSQLAHEAKGSV